MALTFDDSSCLRLKELLDARVEQLTDSYRRVSTLRLKPSWLQHSSLVPGFVAEMQTCQKH